MFIVENIESSNYPIYKVSLIPPKEESDAEDFFTFFENLMSVEYFALILTTQGAKSFSPENKKRLNIWFKNNKKELGKRCLGLARITKRQDLLQKFASKAMIFAMPCPYFVIDNDTEALEWIQQKINLKK